MECSAARAGWFPFTGLVGAALLCGALLWAGHFPGVCRPTNPRSSRLPRPKPADDKPAEDKPAEDKPAGDKPAGEKQGPPQAADEAASDSAAEDEAASADGPRIKIVPLRMAAGHAVPLRADLEQAFQDRVDSLIRQLGDSSYTVRQRASKQLLEIGIAGQPLLSEALADEDAEVRNRSAQVLTKVVEADFRARLEAFANDPQGKQDAALPSWSRFRQAFGDEKVARDLFVEMQRTEPALLDALEANPKAAGELLVLRMQSIMQTIQWPQLNGGNPVAVPLGTVCSLLFVSAIDGVAIGDQDAIQLYNLIHQASFQTALRSTPSSTLLKKLLGMWILENSAPRSPT